MISFVDGIMLYNLQLRLVTRSLWNPLLTKMDFIMEILFSNPDLSGLFYKS